MIDSIQKAVLLRTVCYLVYALVKRHECSVCAMVERLEYSVCALLSYCESLVCAIGKHCSQLRHWELLTCEVTIVDVLFHAQKAKSACWQLVCQVKDLSFGTPNLTWEGCRRQGVIFVCLRSSWFPVATLVLDPL